MKVTSKGQVTIPQRIRKKLKIGVNSEIEFKEENGRVYIVKKRSQGSSPSRFRRYRGIATVRMTTDEIMALTRGGK